MLTRTTVIAAIISATVVALSLVACSGSASRPTNTPKALTATPSPLFTLDEARQRVQEYAAKDPTAPANGTHVACFPSPADSNPPEDRYSAERKTWVIHCRWENIKLDEILTARAGDATPPPIVPVGAKTYLLDDVAGTVRE
jgi:hypothetical protein